MNVLITIGFVSVGIVLGILLLSALIVQRVHKKRMVVIFFRELDQYDVILAGVGNRGKLLWKNPKFDLPGAPKDMDLNKWR